MRKIQKILVYEQVAQEIQNYIQEKDLQEGDKLPSVEEMTQMFGVGRSSLREALRYLEAVDVIQVENGKGIFVREVDTFRFQGKVKIERERHFLLNTLDVRRALEGKAVELASKSITAIQINEMESCLEEYRILKESGKDTSRIDLAFHGYIIKASHNPILETVMDAFAGLYEKFFDEPLGNNQLFAETYPYHRTMFDAIASHDTDKALEEFNKMMDCIENKIRSYE
ncbi:FadR/GntR family transcriptional regulator [Cohnella abietis]|uniref:Transcriptional regulator n=1 Tax=Cohnella abietis TaxID=2507935 RepID=A0A3T1DET8_9BACL|nr:FadR/GntR family transcriptional regulator [Cohnella abietis]BBI36415.1 transcriptional regulator [Cohnella abietis]